jgi:hypothetical protein
MISASAFAADGGCTCRAVRYRMLSAPLIVHCCHCRWCQRETGSAFVLNVLIEADRMQSLQGMPVFIDTPTNSGKGQKVARCPECQVALWSNYAGAGDRLRFVRVGTFDEPDRFPPDIHIYTESKQPWLVLPQGARAVSQYYNSKEVWSAASLARRQAIFG